MLAVSVANFLKPPEGRRRMVLKITSLIGLSVAELALQVNPGAIPEKAEGWLEITVFGGLIGVLTWILKDMSAEREAARKERAEALKTMSDMQAAARAERAEFRADLTGIREHHAAQTAVLAASMKEQSTKYDSTMEKLGGLTLAITRLVEGSNLQHVVEAAIAKQRSSTPVPQNAPPPQGPR